MDTLIHLLKGSLGSGILAMPMAFKNAGLFFGLIATFTIGAVCTYCVHILVDCAHILCKRTQRPSLGFAEVAETAFLVGPESVQKYARLAKYKCEKNEVPITSTNGSTLPLVERSNDEDAALYNPFEHRKLAHPTSDMDTLIHLLKGSLGSGILAMPMAFKNAGLFFGLIATFTIGAVCTYCVHILVDCAHILCKRTQRPSLGFAEVAETAFLVGPESVQKYARLAKAIVNTFLVLDLIGCCCVYVVFVSENVKQVLDNYMDTNWDVRIYMAILLPLLIAFSLVRNLKFLAPFSMVANALIAAGLGITFYYIFTDLPAIKDVKKFSSFSDLPLFFGIAIFALEGIGVVMPLENNMKTPTHFIGCPGVLNIGMLFVITLYSTVGFFGYLKYQEKTMGSITLNLDQQEILAQAVKLMIAAAIFLTYGLQFYVPMEIIWKNIKNLFSGAHKLQAEYTLRVVLVTFTVGMAIAIPNLGPFISLVGALCLSTLGLMFPSVIELVTNWEQENGLGCCYWRLWKNILIIMFGVLGLLTGTYTSIDPRCTSLALRKRTISFYLFILTRRGCWILTMDLIKIWRGYSDDIDEDEPCKILWHTI